MKKCTTLSGTKRRKRSGSEAITNKSVLNMVRHLLNTGKPDEQIPNSQVNCSFPSTNWSETQITTLILLISVTYESIDTLTEIKQEQLDLPHSFTWSHVHMSYMLSATDIEQ